MALKAVQGFGQNSEWQNNGLNASYVFVAQI